MAKKIGRAAIEGVGTVITTRGLRKAQWVIQKKASLVANKELQSLFQREAMPRK